MPTRHAWMLEVLKDLRTYSEEHDLPQSQGAIERAFLVVKDDIYLDENATDICCNKRTKLTLIK